MNNEYPTTTLFSAMLYSLMTSFNVSIVLSPLSPVCFTLEGNFYVVSYSQNSYLKFVACSIHASCRSPSKFLVAVMCEIFPSLLYNITTKH